MAMSAQRRQRAVDAKLKFCDSLTDYLHELQTKHGGGPAVVKVAAKSDLGGIGKKKGDDEESWGGLAKKKGKKKKGAGPKSSTLQHAGPRLAAFGEIDIVPPGVRGASPALAS
jgi:hypothetical protein